MIKHGSQAKLWRYKSYVENRKGITISSYHKTHTLGKLSPLIGETLDVL